MGFKVTMNPQNFFRLKTSSDLVLLLETLLKFYCEKSSQVIPTRILSKCKKHNVIH